MFLFFSLSSILWAQEPQPQPGNGENDQEQESENKESEGDSQEKEDNPKDETPPKENDKPKASTPSLSQDSLKEAEELKDLNVKQLLWLQPLAQRFEQNPYLHVDFTAYSLEWGEYQIGLNNVKVGVLPRTQVGTSIPMWVLGLKNFDAKINLVRLGPFDLALDGNWLDMATPDFNMGYISGGLNTSIRITEPWTVHFGTQFMNYTAKGLPDLEQINPMILLMSNIDAQSYRQELADDNVNFDINAQAVTLKLSTDLRLNRRDSWIFQAQGIIWHNLQFNSTLNNYRKVPAFLNVDQVLALDSEGGSDITKSYVLSVAHQWSFDNSYLRIGFGWSSMEEYSFIPALIQSVDYAWRFGGKSKNREKRIRDGWKDNRSRSDKKGKERKFTP